MQIEHTKIKSLHPCVPLCHHKLRYFPESHVNRKFPTELTNKRGCPGPPCSKATSWPPATERAPGQHSPLNCVTHHHPASFPSHLHCALCEKLVLTLDSLHGKTRNLQTKHSAGRIIYMYGRCQPRCILSEIHTKSKTMCLTPLYG
jgi:hypothetical protein